MNNRIYIFIDGENLRYSLDDILTKEIYNRTKHYLPHYNWSDLFKFIVSESDNNLLKGESVLIRAYWYVISAISYNEEFKKDTFKCSSITKREKYLNKYVKHIYKKYEIKKGKEKDRVDNIEKSVNYLEKQSNYVEKELNRWNNIQSKIQRETSFLQFQRFGYLPLILDNGEGKIKFLSEKGVDIKLATDLIAMKDMYDIAIIISGDGDYIPVIIAVKNMGKQVAVVNFKDSRGNIYPRNSKKLIEHCDFNITITQSKMKEFCNTY